MSYSHRDEEWLQRLQVVLAPLLRHEPIEIWSDARLEAGDKWRSEIDRAIQQASIALLLVSPDFLASDFINKDELPPILSRARAGGLRIMWLAISHSLYEHTEIAEYQALNEPSRPLSGLAPVEVDKILVAAGKAIHKMTTPPVAATARVTESRVIAPAASVEREFWLAVENYRKNALVRFMNERVAVDQALAAAGSFLPVSRLSEILDDAPNDGEIQMAVAVVLGACVAPGNENSVTRMFIQLLKSPFERARYRAAFSIERHLQAAAMSATSRAAVAAALAKASAREKSEIVRDRLTSTWSALKAVESR